MNQNTISLQEADKSMGSSKDIISTSHSDIAHTDNLYWTGKGKDILGSSPLQMFDSVSHIATPFEVPSSTQMDYISFENFKHISNSGSMESLQSMDSVNASLLDSSSAKAQQSYLKPPLSPRMSSPSLAPSSSSGSSSSSSSSSNTTTATPLPEAPVQKDFGSLEKLLEEVHSAVSAEKPSGLYDASVKPPYSYASMIALSIMESGQGRLTLSQIYSWISTHFPFYKLGDSGWQNSIRHNLSLNDAFIKGGKCADGKGHFWQIETGQEYKVLKVQSKNGRNPGSGSNTNNSSSNKSNSESNTKKKNLSSKEKSQNKNNSETSKLNNSTNTVMPQINTAMQILTPLSSFSSASLPVNVQFSHTAQFVPETPTSGDNWEWSTANGNVDNHHYHFNNFDTPMDLAAKNDKCTLKSEKKYNFPRHLTTPNDTKHNDELFLMDTNAQLSKDNYIKNNTKQLSSNNQVQYHFQDPNNVNKHVNYWNNPFGTLSEPLITHETGFSCSFNSSFESPNNKTSQASFIDQQTQDNGKLSDFKLYMEENEKESENHFDFTKTPKPTEKNLQESLESERNFMLRNTRDDEFARATITETPYRFNNFLSSTPKTLDCVLHQESSSKQFPENNNSGMPAGQTPKWKTPAAIDDFFTSPVTFKSPKNQHGVLASSASLMHSSLDEQLHPTAGLLLSPNERMTCSQKSSSSAKHTLLTSPRFDLINKRSRVLGHGGLFGVDVYSVLQRALDSQKQKKLLPHPELKDKN
ncbi:hypothetical protein ACO0QE_003767 [Hanseniaspora vineae]